MTLFDVYKKLRDTYGFYISRPFSHYCPGSDGPQLAQRIVDAFRQNPPLIIGDGNLQRLEDFKTQKIYYFDQKIGETSRISHPQQNLLRSFMTTEIGSPCALRVPNLNLNFIFTPWIMI